VRTAGATPRTLIGALLIAGPSWFGGAPAAGGNVPKALVVGSSSAPAYAEAMEGARSALAGASATIKTASLDRPGGEDSLRALLAEKPDVVIAVGSAAMDLVSASKSGAAVVSTMVLESEPRSRQADAGGSTVTLDLPPAAMLARLKQLFPERKRVAVIRGPALTTTAAVEIQSQARRLGYEIRIVESPGPKELLDAIGGLRGSVDFIWCLPDRSLYQGPTVAALALAALRNRVPLIGFSEGLVRAGALVGFYPDYRDVGAQAGESALRLLTSGHAAREYPRKVRTAVNDRVARVLGVERRSAAADDVVVVK
jgi:putative ABC transport system substrate-binding protein